MTALCPVDISEDRTSLSIIIPLRLLSCCNLCFSSSASSFPDNAQHSSFPAVCWPRQYHDTCHHQLHIAMRSRMMASSSSTFCTWMKCPQSSSTALYPSASSSLLRKPSVWNCTLLFFP